MNIEEYNSKNLIETTNEILSEARTDMVEKSKISMPIAQLSTLGAGIAPLIPAVRTMTQSINFSTKGLYQVANAGVGDVLKMAKNGNAWGAIKTASGGSKLAQLKEVGSIAGTSSTKMPINPAMIMIAVALYSIEKQIGEIAATAKEILSFLEIEKESEIEADVETLMSIISNYKYNWDNSHYVESNHKMVLDIQRTARKNMLSYQKKVEKVINSKAIIISNHKVNSELNELEKKFKYYRLSLYTFSLSSLIEIMLGENYKEEYIIGIKTEVENLSKNYRESFYKCSDWLEKIGKSSLETNILKGIGRTSNAIGKIIGKIPLVKNGQADEFLQEKGEKLNSSVNRNVEEVVEIFGKMSNPKTAVLTDKMNDIVNIFNKTSKICFDDKHIYLMEN